MYYQPKFLTRFCVSSHQANVNALEMKTSGV